MTAASGMSRHPAHAGVAIIGTMRESEIIFAVQESPEGGFEARALDYPIFTEAESIEELRQMVRDAVRCHFERDAAPSIIRLHFVRDEVISV